MLPAAIGAEGDRGLAARCVRHVNSGRTTEDVVEGAADAMVNAAGGGRCSTEVRLCFEFFGTVGVVGDVLHNQIAGPSGL